MTDAFSVEMVVPVEGLVGVGCLLRVPVGHVVFGCARICSSVGCNGFVLCMLSLPLLLAMLLLLLLLLPPPAIRLSVAFFTAACPATFIC